MSPSTLVIRINSTDCTVEASLSEGAGGLYNLRFYAG